MTFFSEKYPTFYVSEEDLTNFDKFCEEKYGDVQVQQHGFFKVCLKEGVKRGSTFEEVKACFGNDIGKHLKKQVVVKHPLPGSPGSELYSYINGDVDPSEKGSYQKVATSPSTYEKDNCCMKAYKEVGVEAYFDHFFNHIIANVAVPYYNNPKMDKKKARNKRGTYKAAQRDLDEFRHKKMKPAEHFECLKDRMVAEDVKEASSTSDSCKCSTCLAGAFDVHQHSANSDILYSAGIDENVNQFVKFTENFSMATMVNQNMLSILGEFYPGLHAPNVYVGSPHSFFTLHIEDYAAWSFNVLLYGFPKAWIIIPPEHVGKLTRALILRGYVLHAKCMNILGHKDYLPSLKWLKKEGIPFTAVVQREGEAIVLTPNSAHMGANLNFNFSQAANFGTKSWLPFAINYPNCGCINNIHFMDLTGLISNHAPKLLNAYLGNEDIWSAVHDPHFHKSNVFSRLELAAPPPPPPPNKARIKCPFCLTNWAGNIRARNVKSHINRHHEDLVADQRYESFMNENFPTTSIS